MGRSGSDDRTLYPAVIAMTARKVPLDWPALTQEELRDIGLRQRSPDVNDLL